MQTWVTSWWVGKHRGKKANASVHLTSLQGRQVRSRGGTSPAAVMLPSSTCLRLSLAQRWGRMGAVELLAVDRGRLAGASSVIRCQEKCGRPWVIPQRLDYSHDWHLSLFAEGRGHAGLSACRCL